MRILAKSNPESTLQEHINDALAIADSLEASFPNIGTVIKNDNFWQLLRLCVIFHDLGKSHFEFQKLLREEKNQWNFQRHELFSLPFIEALKIGQKELVYFVVAGHHKDYETLIQKLNEYGDNEDWGLNLSGTKDIPTFEAAFKENIPVELLFSFINQYQISLTHIDINNPQNILNQYISKRYNNPREIIELLLLAGAFKQCDHLASAGINKINSLYSNDFNFLYQTGFQFYNHQKKASKVIGNTILTAPTGSGKTETSLLWLQNQMKTIGIGRVFYILPFTASINAMFERLNKGIPEKVGLLHGKLASFIEQKFEDDDLVDEKRKREIREQFKNLVTPFKIVTPFQLLKNIFALKGFEKGIFEWAGGYFIFDEIHAYNPKVFAQIIVLIKFAINYLNVKVFVMTATLPGYLRKEIEKVLGDFQTINADLELYKKFKRHRIIIESGKLNENIDLIQSRLNKNEKVLVVCNTVKQAQLTFKNLKSNKKVLLHSSFNATDRNRKEKELKNGEIKLLVGTQAIEVSLDIDYVDA